MEICDSWRADLTSWDIVSAILDPLIEANASKIADASNNLRDFVYMSFCPFKRSGKGDYCLIAVGTSYRKDPGQARSRLPPAIESESIHVKRRLWALIAVVSVRWRT